MSRIVVAVLTALVTIAGAVLVTQRDSEPSRGTVEVVFDNAKGLVAGQALKVAGTAVGTIDAVRLERTGGAGYRARLTLKVDRDFLPFRADARCRILPQGLLSENFVACEPGSPGKPTLADGPNGVAQVPVTQTSVPASLQDLLNTFSLPTSQRLGVLVSQLGIATAGRGADINAMLRRANPALAQTDRVLALVASQRRRVRSSITQTDKILRDVAGRDRDLRQFVDAAATVSAATAQHRVALGQAIHRLPPLLDALDSTLPAVREISQQGRPLLAGLRTAAPQLTGFSAAIERFVPPAVPAVKSLGRVARTGRAAVRAARPTVRDVRKLTTRAEPFAHSLDQLLISTRDKGGMEGFFRFWTAWPSFLNIYDKVGHLVPFLANAFPRCILGSMVPGRQVLPHCSHALSSPAKGRLPITQSGAGPAAPKLPADTIDRFLSYILG